MEQLNVEQVINNTCLDVESLMLDYVVGPISDHKKNFDICMDNIQLAKIRQTRGCVIANLKIKETLSPRFIKDYL